MTDRQPCGCKHNGSEWTFMCQPCKTEHDTRHAQAAADHQAAEQRRAAEAAFRRLM